MTILQAIILGIVEGLTEFIPVSSTFHLIFASRIMQIPQSDFVKVFNVVIQSGAILSVVILYAKQLWEDKKLSLKVLAAFFPTAIIGMLLHKIIKEIFFETDVLMLTMFFIIGVIFILQEWAIRQGKIKIDHSIDKLTWRDALLAGLFQSLAVIPGVSRSGAVLVGMMFLRYRRDEAAKFSFMLSIPTIFAASALDLIESRDLILENTDQAGLLFIGFITAFISSFFIVKWFIGFLQKNSLVPFGVYRFVALAVILLLLGIGFI